jgi:hypothetical protein
LTLLPVLWLTFFLTGPALAAVGLLFFVRRIPLALTAAVLVALVLDVPLLVKATDAGLGAMALTAFLAACSQLLLASLLLGLLRRKVSSG